MNSTNPSSLFQALLAFQFCTPPSAGFSSAVFCVYHFSVLFGRPIVDLDGGGKIKGVVASNNGCFYFQRLWVMDQVMMKPSGKNSK